MASLILLAAGEGKRMRNKINKNFLEIKGEKIINYSLSTYSSCSAISKIIIVARKEDIGKIKKIVKDKNYKKVKKVVTGGQTRQESVLRGLRNLEIKGKDQIVVVHNAANPLVSEKEIQKTIKAAEKYGVAACAKECTNTVKLTKKNQVVKGLDRNEIYLMETPQAAKFELLKEAFDKVKKNKFIATDELSLLEQIGIKGHIVKASDTNFKITTLRDFELLKTILGDTIDDFLVGVGEDSHKFVSKKELGLKLAGIILEDYKKLDANSDGDVIIHAICNAISSAIGESSLGTYADEMLEKGISDSSEYMKKVCEKAEKKGFAIHNLSISLECATPEIDPINLQIKNSLSHLLDIDKTKIGITATSGEKLSEFGKGKGIRCIAYVSLKK